MNSDNGADQGVWRKHSRQWHKDGAPLRPTQHDGRLMQLPWPDHVQLHAFDHSAEMIASIWRPHAKAASSVQQVRWQSMPLPDHSVEVVVGDGSLNVLPHSDGYGVVMAEVARVLTPNGLMALRCFIGPDRVEALDEIAAAALGGVISSFHALKWRLAMAMDGSENFSVAVADLHAVFNRLFPDRDLLAQRAAWTRETVDTIDAYLGVDTRYTFPTLLALQQLAAPTFHLAEVRHDQYELADRCPTVCFRPHRFAPGEAS